MALKFLGCGSAFNPLMRNTNSYFISDNNLFLVDCGESNFETLYKKGLLQSCNEITVIVTHLHADHAGSLPTLVSYCYYVLNKVINIVHPNNSIQAFLDITGINRQNYRLHTTSPYPNVQTIPYIIKHVDDMQCYGYVIKTDDFTVYVSGDATNIPDEVLASLKNGSLDKLYQDTSSVASSHPTHCDFNTLKQLIPEELRSKVYCVHLDKDYRDEIKAAGFGVVEVE